MPDVKEEVVAKASYIITFFNEVQSLTYEGASYLNTLVQMKVTYPEKDKEVEEEGMEEADQANLFNSIQRIRSFVFVSYVKFNALKTQITQFKEYETRIKENYEKIMKESIPSKETVENYIVSMNELFVVGIVGELLGTSGEILRSVTRTS
jgi:hypothetical protein